MTTLIVSKGSVYTLANCVVSTSAPQMRKNMTAQCTQFGSSCWGRLAHGLHLNRAYLRACSAVQVGCFAE